MISGQCSFNRNESYWWETVYFHASTLVMGEHDWNIVKRLVQEMETAGVIGIGVGLKKEFRTYTCRLKNALSQLFYRQALTDKRMQYLFSKEKEM